MMTICPIYWAWNRHICTSSLTWDADSVISSRSPKQPCLWRMRLPHRTEWQHDGHSPSTGRRWDGSDFRKWLARQITWLLIPQDGWKQLSFSDSWGQQETEICGLAVHLTAYNYHTIELYWSKGYISQMKITDFFQTTEHEGGYITTASVG